MQIFGQEMKFRYHEIYDMGGGGYGQTALVDVTKPWSGGLHFCLENKTFH